MINKLDESWKQVNGLYKCPICSKEYSKKGICSHIFRSHTKDGKYNSFKDNNRLYTSSWNKGLIKETDLRIKKSGEKLKESLNSGKVIPPQTGKPIAPEIKAKISNTMKIAHKEGRAWNIGKSRWNNKASYPEEFFMKVIENEFEDKNYIREFNVGIYSIDFAWTDKKLAIEIDGQQHKRFEEYKQRDLRKDECLLENGWKVLRILWIDMYKDPHKWIKIAKDFIHN